MAMLRVLVDLELRGATSFEEVLHPDKSRLSSLVSSMVVNPRYVKDIVDAILDPEDDNSLMSIIIRYTVSKTGHKPNNMADMRLIGTTNKSTNESTNKRVDMLSGCFASNEEEYAEHARVVRNKRHPEELEKE